MSRGRRNRGRKSQGRRSRLGRGATAAQLFAALLSAALLSACAGSGYTYVSNSDLGVYFKIPEEWTLFDAETVAERSRDRGAAQAGQQWMVAFDAAPQPSLEELISPENPFPAGVTLARTLTDSQRDGYSLASLRNELVNLDQLARNPGMVQRVLQEDLVFDGGLRGEHSVFNVRTAEGLLTFDQTALVDGETRTVYLLAIGCSTDCYERYRDEIFEVSRSWTVQER